MGGGGGGRGGHRTVVRTEAAPAKNDGDKKKIEKSQMRTR